MLSVRRTAVPRVGDKGICSMKLHILWVGLGLRVQGRGAEKMVAWDGSVCPKCERVKDR